MAGDGYGSGGTRGKEKRGKRITSKSTANLRALESVTVPDLGTPSLGSPSIADDSLSYGGNESSILESQWSRGQPQDEFADDLPLFQVGEQPDELIDHLTEELSTCKVAKRSQILTKFSNFLLSHSAYKRIITDQIPWRLESAIIVLTQIVSRSRGSSTGLAVTDASSAIQCILNLILTSSADLLNSVAESVYEALATVCLNLVDVSQMSSKVQETPASSLELMRFAFQVIGELDRNHLINPSVLEPSGFSSWIFWWRARWNEFLIPKEKIIAENVPYSERICSPPAEWLRKSSMVWHSVAENKEDDDEPHDPGLEMWTAGDMWRLDGLCLGTCSLLQSTPIGLLCHPENFFQETTAFVWEMMARLSAIVCETKVEFFNEYTTALPEQLIQAETSALLMGIPHFFSIPYEAFWEVRKDTVGFEELMAIVKDFWWTKPLQIVLELFARGSNWGAEAKPVNRKVSKAFVTLMRDACANVERGDFPHEESVSLVIRTPPNPANEGGATPKSVETELSTVNLWREIFILRLYRTYCGTANGAVAFLSNFSGEWQANTSTTSERARFAAESEKMRKLLRQQHRDQKSALHNFS